MTAFLTTLQLDASIFAILCGITFLAGVVRGFSGFALSALVMASAIMFLPPVSLIPICWWLEMSASLLMARGGWRDANRKTVFGLVIGSAIGSPVGLALTTSISIKTSKIVALCVILVLAATQLAKLRLAFLATRPGLYLSGLTAGIVTGLASVGGMVVALYVLSQQSPAREMRGSLVLFLLISSAVSMVMLILYGVMDMVAVWRGLALAIPAMLGVIAGKRLFIPRFEAYYRPFCLTLLSGLAVVGLVRIAL